MLDSAQGLTSRELHADEVPVNVYYNGNLRLTSILHHDTENSLSTATISLHIATDGQAFSVHHIEEAPSNSTVFPRDGINGYDHIGVGELKFLCNSDAIAYWKNDVGGWNYEGFP